MAIFRLFTDGSSVWFGGFGRYLAIKSVSFTTRHVILSGSFLDAGVKKLETAFSARVYN